MYMQREAYFSYIEIFSRGIQDGFAKNSLRQTRYVRKRRDPRKKGCKANQRLIQDGSPVEMHLPHAVGAVQPCLYFIYTKSAYLV
jgi:hypothetical protein